MNRRFDLAKTEEPGGDGLRALRVAANGGNLTRSGLVWGDAV